ncbi:hypothetical protein D3C74_421420 [compost metagenome]
MFAVRCGGYTREHIAHNPEYFRAVAGIRGEQFVRLVNQPQGWLQTGFGWKLQPGGTSFDRFQQLQGKPAAGLNLLRQESQAILICSMMASVVIVVHFEIILYADAGLRMD